MYNFINRQSHTGIIPIRLSVNPQVQLFGVHIQRLHKLGYSIIESNDRVYLFLPRINLSHFNGKPSQSTTTLAAGSRKREKQPVENQNVVDFNTAKEEELSNASEVTIGGHSDSITLKKPRQIIDAFQVIDKKIDEVCSPASSTVTTADVAGR